MSRRLAAYQAKRDFGTTAEPSGRDGPLLCKSEHRRFVIHKHDATRLHYDLRLEVGDVFKSWAVARGPSLDPGEKRLAVEVEDHPLEYGDFEGTIPRSEYGGGSVMIWDRGHWLPQTDVSPEESLRKGELKFVMAGDKLEGGFVLVRLKRKPGEKHDNWLLIKHRDRWATPGEDNLLDKDLSVASGRTMAMIAKGEGAPASRFMTTGEAPSAAAIWDEVETQRSKRSMQAARAASAPPPITAVAMPKLTHPERALWPDDGPKNTPMTKRDLATYLIEVAPWMIQHLYGRPCSLLRAPDGITGQVFFQRHALPGQTTNKTGGMHTIVLDRDHEPYLQIDDAQSIVNMAQLSVLEFHPWNGLPFQPLVPGRIIFDLDPAPDVAFDTVIEAAKDLRQRLEALGLVPFCKTTGGKGLHVVVPLTSDQDLTWDQAKLFAQTVCAQVADANPQRYVLKMTKTMRAGKIYLDYLRNDLTATAVAPLSPRARPGATVSMPLTWGQVKKGLDPKRFTIRTTPALLAKSNAWGDYASSGRSLKQAVLKLIGGAP